MQLKGVLWGLHQATVSGLEDHRKGLGVAGDKTRRKVVVLENNERILSACVSHLFFFLFLRHSFGMK